MGLRGKWSSKKSSLRATVLIPTAEMPGFYGDGEYVETPVGIAVEIVFAGIASMGATRETAYNETYVLEKHRKAREMGWTIIS